VSKRTGWDRGLSVATDAKNLVGHAGAVLLRACADRTGLTAALGRLFPTGRGETWWDRGLVLIQLAIAIALGGKNLSDLALLAHQAPVFGDPPSPSTARRTLAGLDEAALNKIAKARATVRAHVWGLLAARPGGFPYLTVAGKVLTGWIVIDLDATIIAAHSAKTGAAASFKKIFGFHPLAAWCANTEESLAMLLRAGNAGSNTACDHIRVLAEAIAQIPAAYRAKLLIRIDGAGATHELLAHLEALNTSRRTVRYTVGWTITDADEHAIAALAQEAWEDGLRQDGTADDGCQVAEITGLSTRLAGADAADRPPQQACCPARQETHHFRARHRLALPDLRHQHRPDAGRSRLSPSPVPRRLGPRPRRGGGSGAHEQGLRPAESSQLVLGGQPRLDAGGQPRRRPGCLDPPTWPARPR
jgi:DDE family transposase